MKKVFGIFSLSFLITCSSLPWHTRIAAAVTPTADFSATPLTWSAPAVVNFTDSSTGSITSWLWNFGDGTQSELRNPVHVYDKPGKYTVDLTVNTADGSDTKVKADYVTVEEHIPIGDEYLIRVDSSPHKKFGLYYPATYKFRLPSGAHDLITQYRYWEGTWHTLPEKQRADNFNGIDAVRFDYASGVAYVSVRFSRSSDNLYLRFVDAAGLPIAVTFDSIPKFYDERKAAVTITLDDWDSYGDSYFRDAVDFLSIQNLFFSVGVVTGDVPWGSVQEKINLLGDLMEISSHSAHHLGSASDYTAYGYDTEATGSRDAIRTNLTFGTHPYVPLYIEPYGYTDDRLAAALTAGDYLISRKANEYAPLGAKFVPWDETQGRYGRGAVSFNDGYSKDDIRLLNQANAIFNDSLAAGDIYHLMDHPWLGFWHPNSYLMRHLDYVKGRNDVWYVPFGQLYLYHFLQERRGNLGILGLTASSVVAGFSATPVTGHPPLEVSFADTSAGNITGWQWDFGDSSTSTSRNPVHTYNAIGTYTVKLTVTGPGGSDTRVQTNLMAVNQSTAQTTVSLTAPADGASFAAPATISMTAKAAAGTGATVKKVDFYANDALVGTATGNPYSVTWSKVAAGNYSLTAKITDSRGAVAVSAPVEISVGNGVPDLTISKSHKGDFKRGQNGASYKITITNKGAGPTVGDVTVTDELPEGMTATDINGSGWTCTLSTLSCTRSDSLAAGRSYPTVKVTVKVAKTATSVTNSATVSGGGEVNTSNSTATDPTVIHK